MTEIFDRETKREKILETRHREMKLREKSKSSGDHHEEDRDDSDEEENLVEKAEAEFWASVKADQEKNELTKDKLDNDDNKCDTLIEEASENY